MASFLQSPGGVTLGQVKRKMDEMMRKLLYLLRMPPSDRAQVRDAQERMFASSLLEVSGELLKWSSI